MAYEQKENSGTLFLNSEKSSDRAPDMSGRLFIGKDLIPAIERGDMLRIAGWEKVTQSGGGLLSLAVSEERKREGGEPSPDAPKSAFIGNKQPF